MKVSADVYARSARVYRGLGGPDDHRHALRPDLLQRPQGQSTPRVCRTERQRDAGHRAHLARHLHAVRFGLLRRKVVGATRFEPATPCAQAGFETRTRDEHDAYHRWPRDQQQDARHQGPIGAVFKGWPNLADQSQNIEVTISLHRPQWSAGGHWCEQPHCSVQRCTRTVVQEASIERNRS
jgi:hypothetical protein